MKNIDLNQKYRKGKEYQFVDDFSLTNSGIVHNFISRLGLGGTSARHITRKILYLISIT
jgi:hypothetical protein